jgi:hypothetical protein
MPREMKGAVAYCARSGAVALALTLLALAAMIGSLSGNERAGSAVERPEVIVESDSGPARQLMAAAIDAGLDD